MRWWFLGVLCCAACEHSPAVMEEPEFVADESDFAGLASWTSGVTTSPSRS